MSDISLPNHPILQNVNITAFSPVGSPTGLLLYVSGIDQIIQRPAYRAHGQLCVPADRADGGEAFPLPVRTAAQIHVYRHSPAGQVIRPNSIEPAAHTFSCISPGFCRSGNRSCPGTICCPGGIPYSFSIFLLNSLLPAYFTSRCACCSNAYGSVNVRLEDFPFLGEKQKLYYKLYRNYFCHYRIIL